VQTAADVLAIYPRQFRTDGHPVLDAINEAHAGIHRAYTDASDYAAEMSDILRARAEYLDGLLGDHGCYRAPGELDDDYRARGFAWQGVVAPEAVVAVVDALLAPYTTTLAQCCESIADRYYVEDGSAVWGSFVNTSVTLNGPSYPDRLYPGDATLNGGAFRLQTDPGEPLIFLDDAGRQFFLRVPLLNDADGPTAYAEDGTATSADVGLFVETGTATVEMAFASRDYLLSDETYNAIIQSVNRIKGQGIRWEMVVDPRLE